MKNSLSQKRLRRSLKRLPTVMFFLAFLAFPSFSGAEDNATQPAPPRKDNYLGTFSEGIHIGRDPVTGDNIIQVTAPNKEEQEKQGATTIIVQPEVNVPAQPTPGPKSAPGAQ